MQSFLSLQFSDSSETQTPASFDLEGEDFSKEKASDLDEVLVTTDDAAEMELEKELETMAEKDPDVLELSQGKF